MCPSRMSEKQIWLEAEFFHQDCFFIVSAHKCAQCGKRALIASVSFDSGFCWYECWQKMWDSLDAAMLAAQRADDLREQTEPPSPGVEGDSQPALGPVPTAIARLLKLL